MPSCAVGLRMSLQSLEHGQWLACVPQEGRGELLWAQQQVAKDRSSLHSVADGDGLACVRTGQCG